MRITLHRSNQIGGCITEIQSNSGTKIIIDLGHNLPRGDEEAPDEYASPEAMARLLEGVSAVLYTHNHGDHVELFNYVPDSIPQYIGPLAARLMEMKYEKLSVLKEEHDACVERIQKLAKFHHYEKGIPFKIGDITVTPFYVSHSATDSYMLRIQCDGKTALHTGDFREHGYLGCGLRPVLAKYHIARHVDALIIEGTNVGQAKKLVMSEQEVCEQFKEVMKQRRNVFILCSSQDADRLESIYKAHWSRPWHPLVCDSYQKKIMMAIADFSKGQGSYYQFDENKIIDYWPTKENLIAKMKECGFTMLIRKSVKYEGWLKDILPFCKPEETSFVYSMYRGYVEPEWNGYSQETFDFIQPLVKNSSPCLKPGTKYDYNHTSGHASMQSLKEICELIAPRTAIIPIHKDADADYHALGLTADLEQKIVDKSAVVNGIEVFIDNQ